MLLDIATTAGILFVVASGLLVIYGVLRVINFAHGAFLTAGAYVPVCLGWAGVSPWLAAPAAFAAAQKAVADAAAALGDACTLDFVVEGDGDESRLAVVDALAVRRSARAAVRIVDSPLDEIARGEPLERTGRRRPI